MTLFESIVLAVVEGLTEYLPVSSTGHIILTSALFGIEGNDFVKNYTVIVQFGAILSVVAIYRRDILKSFDIYKKLFVAFLPAAIIGLMVKDRIDALLGSVETVAWALILGGIVLVWVDRKERPDHKGITVTYKQALVIGLAQCLAFIPGVSRSAASILGGLSQGLDRRSAAEFSFLLALPTLGGATAIKLLKIAPTITPDQITLLVAGNIVSFIVGWLAIKGFLSYLSRYGFAQFGWYRIAIGGVILALIYSGFGLHII